MDQTERMVVAAAAAVAVVAGGSSDDPTNPKVQKDLSTEEAEARLSQPSNCCANSWRWEGIFEEKTTLRLLLVQWMLVLAPWSSLVDCAWKKQEASWDLR